MSGIVNSIKEAFGAKKNNGVNVLPSGLLNGNNIHPEANLLPRGLLNNTTRNNKGANNKKGLNPFAPEFTPAVGGRRSRRSRSRRSRRSGRKVRKSRRSRR